MLPGGIKMQFSCAFLREPVAGRGFSSHFRHPLLSAVSHLPCATLAFARLAASALFTIGADISDGIGGANVNITGGNFTRCRSTGNGGFLFASDGAVVTITDGTVTNNVAQQRAGVVREGSIS